MAIRKELKSTRQSRVHLFLEQMPSIDMPSSLVPGIPERPPVDPITPVVVQPTPFQDPGMSPPGTPPTPGGNPVPLPGGLNQPPKVHEFRALRNGPIVTFSGRVTDDQTVAGLTVTVDVGGQLYTGITDANGNFSFQGTVPLGSYTAACTVVDSLGAVSAPSYYGLN